MRKITQLLMHDSAVQLFSFGVGWSEFHSEKFQLNYETRDWLQSEKNGGIFNNPLPDEVGIEREYTFADEVSKMEIEAYGEVVAPSMLNLELRYKTKEGEEWTEHVTYCGHFTVWWDAIHP